MNEGGRDLHPDPSRRVVFDPPRRRVVTAVGPPSMDPAEG